MNTEATIEIGGKVYTLRSPLTMGMVVDVQSYGKALEVAEKKWQETLEDDDKARYYSMWLKLCRTMLIQDVSELSLDKIEIADFMRLSDFFGRQGEEIRLRYKPSSASSQATGASTMAS